MGIPRKMSGGLGAFFCYVKDGLGEISYSLDIGRDFLSVGLLSRLLLLYMYILYI